MYDIEAILNNLANQTPTWLLFIVTALCLAVLSKSADKMIDGAVALPQRTRLPRSSSGPPSSPWAPRCPRRWFR